MPTTTKRIDRLTPAQVSRFGEFIAKWTAIGLCTDPADRPAAEEGVRLAYEIAGLLPPKKIVWCGSPLSQGLTRAIVFGLRDAEVKCGKEVRDSVSASVRASVRDSVSDSVSASVWASVRDSVSDSVWASVRDSVWASVWDSVRASVRDSVWASVRDSVSDSVWDSVRASVRDSVSASVRASVRDSVRASVRDSVRDSVWASVRSQHEAGWLSFYDYFKQAAGLDEQTQRLAGLWKVAQSAGWWLPHQNICWISERHNILNRNDRGQLHCEDGPALAYPDGFCIWSINGVRVGEQIVMRPETQCASDISAEQNAEVKRVRIERFGWTRYLRDVKARVIEHVTNAVSNTDESLMDCDGMRVLVCSCPSTARVYSLEVPGDCPSVEQAQNYLSGGRSRRIIVAT